MDFKGRISDIRQDWSNGHYLITFEILNSPDYVRRNYDIYKALKELRISLDEWKERRSLSANSYFHKLVSLIAEASGESLSKTKNDLITSYGQYKYWDSEVSVIKCKIPPEDARELEYLHLKLIGFEEHEDGEWYIYREYRGSHSYNTKEMARLISSTVELAHSMDIPTLSEAEVERLVNRWRATA